MRTLTLLLALTTAATANAQTGFNNLRINYSQVRNGNMLYPPAMCPEVNERYEQINQKITVLKTAIKKEAKCDDEQIKVDSFSKIVEEGRGEFKDLVAKGLKQKLTDVELAKISKYIDSVASAGGIVADIIWGSSCFIDDKRNVVTADLVATVLNEATSAYASLESAPYGNAVRVLGRISSSLIVSIDKIIRKRTAYDFQDADQRKLFSKALCSYNVLRPQIDEITRVDAVYTDWSNYFTALQAQVRGIAKACSECESIAQQFNKDYLAKMDYTFAAIPDLKKKFETDVAAADARFLQPIGSQIVLDLRSMVWAQYNMNEIQTQLNELGDIERDRVSALQESMEEFLFVKNQPRLVSYYQNELGSRLTALGNALSSHMPQIGEGWKIVESRTSADMAAQLFADRGSNLGKFTSVVERDAYLESARSEITRKIGEVASALLVIEKNCTFTRAAKLRFEQGMHKVCSANRNEKKAYDLLWKLGHTTHKQSPMIKAVFEVPSTGLLAWAEHNKIKLPRTDFIWTANHLQSLVLLMTQLRGYDAAIYELKINATELPKQ